MPWPESIALQFRLVDKSTTNESDYYGPFNSLLTHLFPVSEFYQVAPQFKCGGRGSIDFSVIFLVTRCQVPVFFVELKTYVACKKGSMRIQADNQMRERFIDFCLDGNPIPTLYGLCAFGTRFCVYEYDIVRDILTPEHIPRHQKLLTDAAPEKWWDLDVLEPLGEARLKEIVDQVKVMAAKLPTDCEFFACP